MQSAWQPIRVQKDLAQILPNISPFQLAMFYWVERVKEGERMRMLGCLPLA